jgi:hypothetical protein
MPEQKDVPVHAFRVIDGGAKKPVTVWDARAEVAIGTMISRYLAESPAPADSVFVADLQDWARRLTQHGQVRLEEAGERFLSVAARQHLTDAQVDGHACVLCGATPDAMVPAGWGPAGQMFACANACKPKGER